MKKIAILAALILGTTLAMGSSAKAQGHSIDVFAGYSFQNDGYGDYFGDAANLHGYSAAVTWNFNRFLGLEGNFAGHNGSGNYETETNSSGVILYNDRQTNDDYTFLFGPKITYAVGHKKNFELFSHFLVGVDHFHEGLNETGSECEGECGSAGIKGTGFGFQTGGGVDWFHGRWGIRILEVDYVRESGNGTCHSINGYFCAGSGDTETFNSNRSDFRLSTGVIYRFGGRGEE